MSLFSESRINIAPDENIVHISMSNQVLNPILAVSTYQKIFFFNDNGEKLEYDLSRNIQPSFIEWHPNLPTLAIGWASGKFLRFNYKIISLIK